ncbi:fumarylacetoacetate hydrolase family protein [Brevibacterium oceani]|uniref:fumarylacetoacetate hydrolase family protein n=1 Tax=Brevibacterium oceani TaxID=358099 RepID=UPI001B327A6C|nr:fumarylacetoacetate hydrolase family protein [Brevibacterium oceani]
MKLANSEGRLVIVTSDGATDIAKASGGRFGPDPHEIYDRWEEFSAWAEQAPLSPVPFDEGRLDAPVPRPRQVFAIALNYREHAEESGMSLPEAPSVFTKFPSSIEAPTARVGLVDGDVDWEVELVAVIGTEADHVSEDRAWSHVAGLTVGQDISERAAQLAGGAPQFSLAKSHRGFSPIGPWLVTTDEFDNPDDLALSCSINGEEVQNSRTSDLIFSVPSLVSQLSETVRLLPGDLIFTGTPSGVGLGREPKQYLALGDRLVSTIEGIGTISQTFVRPAEIS